MAASAPTPDAALAKLSIEENGKSNGASSNGSAASSPEFKEQFKAFSKFGDTKSDGKLITLSQSDKWLKQAKVIDKKITTTDTAIHFKKLKSLKVTLADYNKFLEDLAITRKVDLAEIKNKLATCGAPGVAQLTNVCISLKFIKNKQIYNLIFINVVFFFILPGWKGCSRCKPFN